MNKVITGYEKEDAAPDFLMFKRPDMCEACWKLAIPSMVLSAPTIEQDVREVSAYCPHTETLVYAVVTRQDNVPLIAKWNLMGPISKEEALEAKSDEIMCFWGEMGNTFDTPSSN